MLADNFSMKSAGDVSPLYFRELKGQLENISNLRLFNFAGGVAVVEHL
jgi:hypothetical protein